MKYFDFLRSPLPIKQDKINIPGETMFLYIYCAAQDFHNRFANSRKCWGVIQVAYEVVYCPHLDEFNNRPLSAVNWTMITNYPRIDSGQMHSCWDNTPSHFRWQKTSLYHPCSVSECAVHCQLAPTGYNLKNTKQYRDPTELKNIVEREWCRFSCAQKPFWRSRSSEAWVQACPERLLLSRRFAPHAWQALVCS